MKPDTELSSKFLGKLKDGDEDAFYELYKKYSEIVYNVCVRMTDNREDAEDATQETFLKIYRSIYSFRGDAKFSSWIYRITVNVCLNRERRKKRARWVSLDFLFTSEDKMIEDNTEGQLQEEDERVQAVKKAIRSLPESQKTAVILQRYEGMSYKEIADIMDKSLSAVEALLYRAKQNLADKLKKYEKFYF